MSWKQYFEKNKGRAVRKLFVQAVSLTCELVSGELTAIDLGCGAGIEAFYLLSRGWRVVAIDQEESSVSAVNTLTKGHMNERMTTICSSFEDLVSIPEADLIFSYHALPFCRQDHFDRLWEMIRQADKPNGTFAGSFFGLNDDWVKSGHAIGVSKERLDLYFSNFEILQIKEFDKVGDTA